MDALGWTGWERFIGECGEKIIIIESFWAFWADIKV